MNNICDPRCKDLSKINSNIDAFLEYKMSNLYHFNKCVSHKNLIDTDCTLQYRQYDVLIFYQRISLYISLYTDFLQLQLHKWIKKREENLGSAKPLLKYFRKYFNKEKVIL